ncbi:MAG: DUF6745 domain-containing protein [Candidatus Hodarchaeota archaeon]
MQKKTKELLKYLLENQIKIPRRVWGNILWLQNNKRLGIRRNGHIFWKDHNGKREGTWKTFFTTRRRWYFNEREIHEILHDYLLLLKPNNELRPRDIIVCRNVEIRRLLMDRFGFDKFVAEARARLLHRDGSSELVTINLRKEESLTFVKVRDSTTKQLYLLRVPSDVKTCREAIAWTFGLEEEEYDPIKET